MSPFDHFPCTFSRFQGMTGLLSPTTIYLLLTSLLNPYLFTLTSRPSFTKVTFVDTVNSFLIAGFALAVVVALTTDTLHPHRRRPLHCHVPPCILFKLSAACSSPLVYSPINYMMIDTYLRNLLPSSYCLPPSFTIPFFVLVTFFSPYFPITSFSTKMKGKECHGVVVAPVTHHSKGFRLFRDQMRYFQDQEYHCLAH